MHLRLTWRHQLKQRRQHLKDGASCARMLGPVTGTGVINIKKCSYRVPAAGYCPPDLKIEFAYVKLKDPDLAVDGSFSICDKPWTGQVRIWCYLLYIH